MRNSYTEIIPRSEDRILMRDYLAKITSEETIAEIYRGLTEKQKSISSKYFYDARGSKLFEKITMLPEYYPTRTEKSILKKIAPGLANDLSNCDIVELGSGDCSKISILLNAIQTYNIDTLRYIPVDVSREAIQNSAGELAARFPGMTILGMLADFMKHIENIPGENNRLICFFGSTIGNLDPGHAIRLLTDIRRIMKPGDQLLVGMDRVKDEHIMVKAYNDSENITARFNRNILNVVNRYTGTYFNPEAFEHLAGFNRRESRIEMHLKAKEDLTIRFPSENATVRIRKGETIHTENSYKYTLQHIRNFETKTGLKIRNIYTDPDNWFSLVRFSLR